MRRAPKTPRLVETVPARPNRVGTPPAPSKPFEAEQSRDTLVRDLGEAARPGRFWR